MARDYAYASVGDVALHVAVASWTASSRPNATQVHNYLLDVSDQLDSKLAALNYSVPVATGATQAFNLVNAWAAVGGAMFAVAALPQGDKGVHLPFLERRWTSILTMLDEGNLTLPGVDKDSTTGRVRFGTPDACAGASPYFTRGDVEG